MLPSKSLALLYYEQQESRLFEQYQAGEIDIRQMLLLMIDVVTRAAVWMTESELRNVHKLLFITTNVATDLLAKLGRPLPGNDPRRPN
jgi:hypothetical protein